MGAADNVEHDGDGHATLDAVLREGAGLAGLGVADEALRLGTETRTQRERLRKERESNQEQWHAHGKQLQLQHEALRERLKVSAEENRLERQRETQELREMLKRLNQEVDDTILRQNQEEAKKVRDETSADAIRASKQTFVDDRWRKADDLRESLAILRERQRRQEQEYIDTAHMIKAHAKLHSDEAKRQREAERKQLVIETREYEKRLEEEVKAARDALIARKRAVHDTLEESKLVPEGEVNMAVDPEAGPLQMFTRFFGFRKRGQGHSLSSVAA